MFYSGNFECVTRDNPILAQFLAQCVQQQKQAPQLLSAFIKANKAVRAKWEAGGRKRPASTMNAKERQAALDKMCKDAAISLARLRKSVRSGVKDASKSPYWGVACHEAGHAVVATVLGMPVYHATCNGTEFSGGHTRVSIDPMEVESEATMVYAGAAAQSRGTGQVVLIRGGDFDSIEACVTRYLGVGVGYPEADQCKVRWREKAAALVRKHWSAVAEVAAEMIEHGTVSGERIESIVNRKKK